MHSGAEFGVELAAMIHLPALPGAPRDGLARFFAFQHRVADTLWQLFDEPALLPPLSGAAKLHSDHRAAES